MSIAIEILSDDERGIKFENPHDYIKISRAGLRFTQMEKILEYTGIPLQKISELIALSSRQIARYSGDTVLKSNISAHLIQILELYSLGFRVFEEKEKFKAWMHSKVRALNYQSPIELLDTPFGIQAVKTIIGRIEHGVYS